MAPAAAMQPDEIEQVESYRTQVTTTFGEIIAAETDRFPDGQRLLRRFNDAVDHAVTGSPLRMMSEAHNELCIARALLMNRTPRVSTLAYEPTLAGSAKSIDFCGISAKGLTAFVDVKTIIPEPKDRWEQFEKAIEEEHLPG